MGLIALVCFCFLWQLCRESCTANFPELRCPVEMLYTWAEFTLIYWHKNLKSADRKEEFVGHLTTTCPSKPGVRDLWPEGQFQPTSSFINKVLLEHNHTICLHVVHGYFSLSGSQTLSNYSLGLRRKSLLTPAVGGSANHFSPPFFKRPTLSHPSAKASKLSQCILHSQLHD